LPSNRARTVNTEVISQEGTLLSAALVTAEIAPAPGGSTLRVTVQLAALGRDMAGDYRQGFAAGLASLAAWAEAALAPPAFAPDRTLTIARTIAAPPAAVWAAWTDPARLPLWWGPEGFSCRTQRIDLRAGGEWVFDMIGPDGTVYANHHLYLLMIPEARIDYALLRGENGPKHADATARFEPDGAGGTRLTLSMQFASVAECAEARSFGAEALGLQTLGKLARLLAAG
jgi:uncharacterized protein YndB with AHSA1/START domain